jgi:chloramphenicol O-acetyltransferase type A
MNINVPNQGFAPIFTLGKFEKDNDKILLPIAIQVHHAVCDGYHVGKFAEGLQALANDCERLLKI